MLSCSHAYTLAIGPDWWKAIVAVLLVATTLVGLARVGLLTIQAGWQAGKFVFRVKPPSDLAKAILSSLAHGSSERRNVVESPTCRLELTNPQRWHRRDLCSVRVGDDSVYHLLTPKERKAIAAKAAKLERIGEQLRIQRANLEAALMREMYAEQAKGVRVVKNEPIVTLPPAEPLAACEKCAESLDGGIGRGPHAKGPFVAVPVNHRRL